MLSLFWRTISTYINTLKSKISKRRRRKSSHWYSQYRNIQAQNHVKPRSLEVQIEPTVFCRPFETPTTHPIYKYKCSKIKKKLIRLWLRCLVVCKQILGLFARYQCENFHLVIVPDNNVWSMRRLVDPISIHIQKSAHFPFWTGGVHNKLQDYKQIIYWWLWNFQTTE